MPKAVAEVCLLLSSIELCVCGHPEGLHEHGLEPSEPGHDVCWYCDDRACTCHTFASAGSQGTDAP